MSGQGREGMSTHAHTTIASLGAGNRAEHEQPRNVTRSHTKSGHRAPHWHRTVTHGHVGAHPGCRVPTGRAQGTRKWRYGSAAVRECVDGARLTPSSSSSAAARGRKAAPRVMKERTSIERLVRGDSERPIVHTWAEEWNEDEGADLVDHWLQRSPCHCNGHCMP